MKSSPLLLISCIAKLAAQSDNFDDGDDAGWLRSDPLGGLGAGPITNFEFDNGTYRIFTTPSPSPAAAGPSRGGAFRQDVIYQNDFFVTVDIPAYDADLDQAIGILTMVQPNPGLVLHKS